MRRIWIGGAPCSGKSAISEAVSEEFGLPIYHADEFFQVHGASAPLGSVLQRIVTSSFAEIFERSVEAMLADFLDVSREEFPMIVKDLAAPAWAMGAVIEGCALPPSCVQRVAAADDGIVYLIPTADFQREHYALRPWAHELLQQTADSALAWENWRARDAQFALCVAREALTAGFSTVGVDGSTGLDGVTEIVKRSLRRGGDR